MMRGDIWYILLLNEHFCLVIYYRTTASSSSYFTRLWYSGYVEATSRPTQSRRVVWIPCSPITRMALVEAALAVQRSLGKTQERLVTWNNAHVRSF
jgi:hypothetical protein